jgi:uncharacterized protein YqhQ
VSDLLLTIAVNAANATPAPFFYGGQAVIEGVLMRGRDHYAVAARKPDGEIVVISEPLQTKLYRSNFWSLPFMRGIVGLWEMLSLGMRALSWSANVQLGEDAEISPRAMRASMVFSTCFGLFLALGLPYAVGQIIHSGGARTVRQVLIEGALRAVILLGYLFLVGMVPAVGRVFAYHGAEHKAINNLESGNPGDVAHVRQASRLHPRCGTGFIVVVALVSVLVFAPLGTLPTILRHLLQILLIPVVAGISYEGIRALAKVRHSTFGRIALIPVLGAQRLTTREPDDRQMEVAIVALNAARQGEGPVSEQHDALVP